MIGTMMVKGFVTVSYLYGSVTIINKTVDAVFDIPEKIRTRKNKKETNAFMENYETLRNGIGA